MAAEQQVTMTAAQLQTMLEAVVAKMKEPTEAEKRKMEEEHKKLLLKAKEEAEIAKAEENRRKNRWWNCPHSHIFNGRTFHKWRGQVNSDGMVVPVCNICNVEAPAFSAKLLPDEGKQGVNFEEWVRCDKDLLIELHQKSFPNGCGRNECFGCKKKA